MRSTNAKEKEGNEKEEDNLPSQDGKKNKDMYIEVWDTQSKIFTDQTGKFPY